MRRSTRSARSGDRESRFARRPGPIPEDPFAPGRPRHRGRRVAYVELVEKRVELLAAEGRPRGETGSGGGRSFMS